jgi:hypothetical protein
MMFGEKVTGNSGINWREHFSLHKKMLLLFPADYCTELLLWFDGQIFTGTPASSTVHTVSHDQKLEVDNLVSRLFQAGVSRSSSTPISSSGTAPAPALVAELPMQMHAVNQARTSAAAAGNKLEQPVESNCHGWSKKSKTKKVSEE